MSNGILPFSAGVAGVAFDGIDNAAFDLFYNADVVANAILRTCGAVRIVPVEEDDHAGRRLNLVSGPLISVLDGLVFSAFVAVVSEIRRIIKKNGGSGHEV